MKELRIPLTAIPEGGVSVALVVESGTIRPLDASDLPVDRIQVEGTITPVGGDYLFDGQLTGKYVHPCDRCLETARIPFDISVSWLYSTEPPRVVATEGVEDDDVADDEWHPIAQDQIDMSACVWEEVSLNVPLKYICDDNCRGLCPVCGVNRNQTSCDCEQLDEAEKPVETNRGFEGLAEMFPDLDPKKQKE